MCAIDALALLIWGSNSVSGRIEAFCKRIPDLADDGNAEIFCKSFRHGLVHEARVKDGSEFSADINRIAIRHYDRLIVNPKLLAREVNTLLGDFVTELYQDPVAKISFVKKIKRKFRFELAN